MTPLSMHSSAVPGAVARRRRALLIGGALGAAAMLLIQPKAVRAQAFDGNITSQVGNVTRTPGLNSEVITIGPTGTANTAIINWRADNVNFLPNGTTATFEGAAGFAVLNRILFGPTDANALIQFNGAVRGEIVGSGGQQGGTIIFSSPGGILVGPTGSFNVGNLVLTTLDVTTNPAEPNGNFFNPNLLEFTLGAADPNAGIEFQGNIDSALPLASGFSSYVAMVAPNIVQGGTVRADGSVAYVAAEGAQLTINNGLFDIVIRDGTTDDTGIDHSGQTGGPDAGSGENQVIYFAAVPKNQAITALLSGAIGYDPATTVGVENGVIVLSAGYGDVSGTTVDTSAPSTGAASFRINEGVGADSLITSDLFGYAVTDATARTTSTFDVRFEQDVTLVARQRASLEATAGGEIVVGGDAVIDASRIDSDTAGVYDVVGGTALVQADGTGSVLITGNLDVLADGRGDIGSGGPGSGTGGTAGVVANSGLVQVGGNLEVSARGYGADSVYASAAAGAGTGGSATVEARNGSAISVTGSVAAFATGEGGYAYGGYYGAGAGTGGSAEVVADASTVQSGGSLTVDARGRGGGLVYSDATAGAGTGGSAGVAALDGGSVASTGDILAYASGLGGAVGSGAGTTGAGNGGSVVISSTSTTPGASVIQSGGLFADASGSAGITTYDEAAVADGTGGSIGIDVGAASSIAITGYASLNAVGNGGAFFGPPGFNYYGVDGGAGSGGSVTIGLADGASLTVTAATNINAGGFGGDGNDAFFAGAGGAGNGGQVDVALDQGSYASLGDLRISAYGAGGYGGAGLENGSGTASPGADGGQGIGGDVTIELQDFSTLVATSLGDSETRGIDVRGAGGDGGDGSAGNDGGGNGGFGALGDAGTVVITSGVGSAVTVNGGIYIEASGEGGYGGNGGYTGGDLGPGGDGGDGGDGVAGSVAVSGAGGTLASTALSVDVGGIGGQGGEAGYSPQFFGPPEQPGYSGNGTGGTIVISVTDAYGESGAGAFGLTSLRASAYSGYSQTNYDIAGSILIEDLGTVDAGLEFATLTAAVTGTPGNAAAAFEFSGDSGPTTVDFGVNVIVSGQANFNAAGSGGLVSGTVASSGPSTFYVNANNIQVFHDSPTADASTIAGENVGLVALNVITGSPDSLINATNGDASLLGNLIEVGRILATGDIDMLSGASTMLVRADAGDDFSAVAGTSFTAGTITAQVGSDITISATDDVRLDNATASGTISLASSAGSVLSDGLLTADQLSVASALNIDLNDVDVVQDLSLAAGGGFIDGNSFASDEDIFLSASGGIILAAADAGDDFYAFATALDLGTIVAFNDVSTNSSGDTVIDAANTGGSSEIYAQGTATLGTFDAGLDINVSAASITLNDGRAGRDVTLDSRSGAITVGFGQAGDDFRARPATGFTGTQVVTTGLGPDADACPACSGGETPTPGEGSNIEVVAISGIDLGTGEAASNIDLTTQAGNIASATRLDAGADINLDAPGNISVQVANAGDDFTADAGGTFFGQTVTAQVGSDITVASVGDLTLNDGTASGIISLTSSAGSILSNGVLTANQLLASAALNFALNEVDVVQDLSLATSNGDIDGNSLNASAGGIFLDASGRIAVAEANAGGDIEATATGDVRLDSGAATGAIDLVSTAGSVFSDGELAAAQLDVSAALDIVFNATGDINGNDFTAGRNIDLDAAGDIILVAADAGDDFFANAGGAFSAGTVTANVSTDIIITAVDDLRLDNGTATGLIDLTSTGGSVLSAGLLTASMLDVAAAQDIALNDVDVVSSLFLQTTGGDISGNSFTSDGSITLVSAGGIDVAIADAVTDVSFTAADDLSLDNVAGENVELTSTAGSVSSGGPFSVANSVRLIAAQDVVADDIQAGGSIILDAGADVSAGNLDGAIAVAVFAGGAADIVSATSDDTVFVQADGDVLLGSATAGTDLDVTGAAITAGVLAAGNDLRLFGTGDVAIDTATAGQDLIASTPGTLSVDQAESTGGSIQLAGDSGITLDRATAAAGIRLAALAGNIDVAGDVTGGGTVDFDAGGNVTLAGDAAIAAGDLIVEAGGNAILNRVDAEGVDIDVLGNVVFEGAVNAGMINVASGDIDITATGSLGTAATDIVTLLALAGPTPAQTVLGGTAEGPGYTLTNTEFGRVFAATLLFRAPQVGVASDRPPDLLVRELAINGLGSADGRVGEFEISTPGYARVEGNVRFTGARADDQLIIRATDRLEVLTPTGSIEMVDAQGQLGGLLNLFSSNIVVASPELAAQLAADPDFEGRTQALRTNNGTVAPEGFIRANGVGLFAGSTVFVQNTGTATEFAGITVGGGALIIGRFQQIAPTANGPGSFSFVGQLISPDEVLLFEFTVDAASMVTLRTYSYAGGTNANGDVIPRGGFDPILALFDAVGTLIDQNDDGGSNVPADSVTGARFDTFFQETLQPGDYTVAVSVYPNFAIGPTLDDGFEGADTFDDVTGDVRTGNFAFDILGVSSATGPGATGPLDVVAFGRRKNPDGTFVTNDDFFAQVDFSKESGTTYLDLAEFNTCLINTGCQAPGPVIRPDPPSQDIIQEVVDGDEDGSDPINVTRTELVDVSFSSEELIEEPVTSGADSVLWDCDRDNDGDCDEDDVDG